MGILGYFRQKGGSHPIHRNVIKKKTENISEFFAKRGVGLANSEISLSEKTGASELLRGGGGSQNFGVFLKEKNIFFMPPLMVLMRIQLLDSYPTDFRLSWAATTINLSNPITQYYPINSTSCRLPWAATRVQMRQLPQVTILLLSLATHHR